jgi:hypothetical protein
MLSALSSAPAEPVERLVPVTVKDMLAPVIVAAVVAVMAMAGVVMAALVLSRVACMHSSGEMCNTF